jgi:hypothetical protein
MFDDIDQQIMDIKMTIPARLREICPRMSPQSAFGYRLEAGEILYRRRDDEWKLSDYPPDEEEYGLRYEIKGNEYLFKVPDEFKTLLEEDDRYELDWSACEMVGDIAEVATVYIYYYPKVPLPHMLEECEDGDEE